MIPSIMYGRAIIPQSDEQIKAVQVIENGVWKKLMGLGGYVTTASLRGKIGASLVETRAMETLLMYAKDTLDCTFDNMGCLITYEMEFNAGGWMNAAIDTSTR